MSQSGEPFDPYYQWLGIPPEEQPPNHYRLLGIRLFEENSEVIQNAADRQMVHLRTFQNGPRAAQSQKLLNEVAAAKLCLLSPDKKAAYDAHLRSAAPRTGRAPPPSPSTRGRNAQHHRLGDVPGNPAGRFFPSEDPRAEDRHVALGCFRSSCGGGRGVWLSPGSCLIPARRATDFSC